MGCGSLEWSSMFDHAMGILEDDADAQLREHLQSCDTCRADGAELLVLSERMREFGTVTVAPGRETFADRTRYDVRNALGEGRVSRASASWRVTSGITESQRIRRLAVRRRNTIAKVTGTVTALFAIPVVIIAIAYLTGLVDFIVDRFGAPIEETLSMDFSDIGLRPKVKTTADLARSVADNPARAQLQKEIARLVRRGLSVETCQPESVVLLEFASSVAADGQLETRELVASAIERAHATKDDSPPTSLDVLGVVRKAKALMQSGKLAQGRSVLELLVAAKEKTAMYYSATAAPSTSKSSPVTELSDLAESTPAVWLEISWRHYKNDDKKAASNAAGRIPFEDLRAAMQTFLAQAD